MRQLSCIRDIQPGRIVEGAEALLQRHFHIDDTKPGDLPQDPEWGFGIARYVGAPLLESDLSQLESLWRVAHLRDPETLDARASFRLVAAGRVRVKGEIVARDGVTAIYDRTFEVTT